MIVGILKLVIVIPMPRKCCSVTKYQQTKAKFLDLDIKISDEKFQVCFFHKEDSFPFSVCLTGNSEI